MWFIVLLCSCDAMLCSGNALLCICDVLLSGGDKLLVMERLLCA